MAKNARIKPPLSTGNNGLPEATVLAGFTVQDWMQWLQARSEQVDIFTGQVLDGEADPFRIVRDSVTRLDTGETTSRFIEGALQLVRDLIWELESRGEKGESLEDGRSAYILAGLLELLSSVPGRIVRQYSDLGASLSEVYDHLTRPLIDSPPRDKYPELHQAALRFLSAFSFPLTESDLLQLMAYSSTASEALRILTAAARTDLDRVRIFSMFVMRCRRNNNLRLVDLEIEERRNTTDADDTKLRQFVISVANELEPAIRREMLALPFIRQLFSRSKTLERFLKDGAGFYQYNWFVEKGEPEIDRPKGEYLPCSRWAFSLLKALNRKVSNALHEKIEFRPLPDPSVWDEQAEDAAYGIVALDPIYLTPRRAKSMAVVPYGYVESLALVYIWSQRSHLASRVEAWKDLSIAINSGFEVGYLAGTSAALELRERLIEEKREIKRHAFTNLDDLLNWLVGDLGHRLLVVDVGFYHTLDSAFGNKRQSNIHLRDNQLHHIMVQYRHPVLAGFAFASDDIIWGEMAREAVEEVLYDGEKIHSGGELATRMQDVGITPLGPSSVKTFEPWVQVDKIFYPRHVRMTEQRNGEVYGRFKA